MVIEHRELDQADENDDKLARIIKKLKPLGVSQPFWVHAEARDVAKVIDDSEEVGGVLYGYTKTSFAILVATNKRILYAHSKQAKTLVQEIDYADVGYINFKKAGIFDLITLYTKQREYTIRTLSMHNAESFMNYVGSWQTFNVAGGLTYDNAA